MRGSNKEEPRTLMPDATGDLVEQVGEAYRQLYLHPRRILKVRYRVLLEYTSSQLQSLQCILQNQVDTRAYLFLFRKT